jgi:hypothetical protein
LLPEGKWTIGRLNECFSIYQGDQSVEYKIKGPSGTHLTVYSDENIRTTFIKETSVNAAKKIWFAQQKTLVEGTYKRKGEKEGEKQEWETQKNKVTVIYQSPEKKSKTYRICGPEKPECKEHKTKEKGCKICEIKREEYNIWVKVNGLDTNCPVYNDETTDVTGYKIEVMPGKGPLSLNGYAFEIEL